jgi:hypothetical protein
MRCSEVKSNLALYSDDILSAMERNCLDEHLAVCPLCRGSLAEFQTIKNSLRSLARPALSADLLANLRLSVRNELKPAFAGPAFHLVDDRRRWLDAWLMPSAVGAFASVVFGMFLLWGILSTARNPADFAVTVPPAASQPSVILARNPAISGPEALDLSPAEYANTRLLIAGESPSVNPQGALIALTRSFVRGEMRDEEVVVVADVFGNGLARIAEVVVPTRDDRAIERLQQALDSDPIYAPFVPASFDRRGETTRVILKFQNVNVKTSLDAPRRTSDRRRS